MDGKIKKFSLFQSIIKFWQKKALLAVFFLKTIFFENFHGEHKLWALKRK